MDHLDLLHIYELGGRLRSVIEWDEMSPSPHEAWIATADLRWPLARLREDDSFAVLHEVAGALLDEAESLIAKVSTKDGEGVVKRDSGRLDFTEVRLIVHRARDLESCLEEHLPLLPSFIVTQKGGYSTDALLESAKSNIPPTLRSLLPQQAHADLREASRCLAFGTWTASGILILRATEAVIRLYYSRATGRDPTGRIWGQLTQEIRDHRGQPTASTDVLAYLEHMRTLHRNQIMHPILNLSEEDALLFFGACLTAMAYVLADIRDSQCPQGGSNST